ncbi:MAG: hypothetical protein ACP5LM_05575 [Thermoplasmata archaeon]
MEHLDKKVKVWIRVLEESPGSCDDCWWFDEKKGLCILYDAYLEDDPNNKYAHLRCSDCIENEIPVNIRNNK